MESFEGVRLGEMESEAAVPLVSRVPRVGFKSIRVASGVSPAFIFIALSIPPCYVSKTLAAYLTFFRDVAIQLLSRGSLVSTHHNRVHLDQEIHLTPRDPQRFRNPIGGLSQPMHLQYLAAQRAVQPARSLFHGSELSFLLLQDPDPVCQFLESVRDAGHFRLGRGGARLNSGSKFPHSLVHAEKQSQQEYSVHGQ